MANGSRFRLAAIGGALAVGSYVVLTNLRVGGPEVTVAVEDLGEALAAMIAALACAGAARRSARARHRLAWALLGVSAACWAAGEVVWSAVEVGLGEAAPFPSLADVGFLAALPVAAAGLLAFPWAPEGSRARLRLVLDGGIAAASIIYVAWAFGLNDIYGNAAIDQPSKLLALLYPAGDIVLLTLVVAAIRSGSRSRRAVLGLLAAAFGSNLVADGSFAYLILDGAYGALGGVADAGWVAGYLALALAAIRGLPEEAEPPARSDIEVWQLAIPWLGVAAVIVTSFWVTLLGRRFGPELGFVGSVLGVLFVASQVLALTDSVRLLDRSRRAESELRERTALLSEIIARAPMGIARITDDLRFLEANPRLCEMLGLSRRALVGARLDQFLSADDVAQARQRVNRMRSREIDDVQVDSEIRTADGRTLWVHRRVAPVFDDRGALSYFLVMFEDVTARHEHDQASLANLAALERLSRLKSEFMSMVSHEFRTALTGIQGYSELMSSEEVPPTDVKEFAGDINADALRLNRMITEMLDLDRIESGRMAMRFAPTDLNDIVAGAVDRARMTTDRHDITVSLDPGVPAVQADSDRLTQIVANLLSNAIKYSPDGGEIAVATHVVDGNVEVGVRDHGQGIPTDFLFRIFGRYERFDGGKNQPVGAGLGLAIAQQIVQLHKGRIWVESKLGEGSDFRFTIPIGVAER